jgi:hypothetical protein
MENNTDYIDRLTSLLIAKNIFDSPEEAENIFLLKSLTSKEEFETIESDINRFEKELSKSELIELIEVRFAMFLLVRTTTNNYTDLKKKVNDIKHNIIWLKQNELFNLNDHYNLKIKALKKEIRDNLTSWLELELEKTEHEISTTTEKAPIDKPLIDLSNTKATEKIIYLKELGVLDFLQKQQPFNTSVNCLASTLSAITGEKTSTIQPYINPIINPSVEQDKNPYSRIKTVQKVKNQLIENGFKPK